MGADVVPVMVRAEEMAELEGTNGTAHVRGSDAHQSGQRGKSNGHFALGHCICHLLNRPLLLCCTAVLLYAMMQERDWKLGGQLAFGYAIMGAPVALLSGYLADRYSRKLLICTVLVIGKVPCLFSYFVTTYPQLFVLRTLQGITVGAMAPLTSSLAGDLFPVERRLAMLAVWAGMLGAGGLVGQTIAGWISPVIGWRWPFIIAAVPSLIAAVLVAFLNEPQRGRCEEALQDKFEEEEAAQKEHWTYTERINCKKMRAIFRIRTNLLGFVQGAPGCVPWGILLAYMTDFLAQDKGLPLQAATTVILFLGGGSAVGGLGGGLLGQYLYNHSKSLQPVLMGLSTAAGAIPMFFLINGTYKDQFLLLYSLAFVMGMVINITGANIRAVFANVNLPETRGTVFGIFCVMDDVGKGFGPFFAAVLIQGLGRTVAFNICTCFWLFCGVVLLCIEFYTTESGVMHRGSTYPLEHMQNVVVDLSGQANISPQISPNISPNETP